MTSAVNVRSQLIHSVIFIFISLCVQRDAATSPGKVLDDVMSDPTPFPPWFGGWSRCIITHVALSYSAVKLFSKYSNLRVAIVNLWSRYLNVTDWQTDRQYTVA